ncbi:hypothetical protein STVIR_0078 [Streptomyces viridochromogenes Tue57]|uniref:Uncharacterized protein n=1 Tax=Streptomyces viridochromogenes Tue57 TaxID=1160705 RepID=L8PMY4_STRVR|nr:hypothetical protein STVIR_0078 [Streptomyces viridochromogenes Tue57]
MGLSRNPQAKQTCEDGKAQSTSGTFSGHGSKRRAPLAPVTMPAAA